MKQDGAASQTKQLEGLWRLVETRAWDSQGRVLPPPYGNFPMGQLHFENGRMLASLCNSDPNLSPSASREYNSYGGAYEFNGNTLSTQVDVSSRADWLGGAQVREARLDGDQLILRPPLREYHGLMQQRELLWQRVWRP